VTREEFFNSWLVLKCTDLNAIHSVIHGKKSCDKMEERLLKSANRFLRLDFW